MGRGGDAGPIPADVTVPKAHLVIVLIMSMTTVAVAALVTSALVDEPDDRPVARVTTSELQAMTDIARAILEDPDATPADRRTADRLQEVIEGVENGEVEVVDQVVAPSTHAPEPAPAPTTTTSTTTTTTTTTAPPPMTAPPWPGEVDSIVVPTIPTLVP